MKILALQAENIKKLVAVEIKPDGNLVQITGKNGQGKTSVLDCIWWALAGASHIQTAPIRNGETTARIRLDLGEIIVTRTFKTGANDGEATSSITVENAKGARFTSPQAMLDDLLGQLSFDPLAFSRMDAKAQFNTLRQFVPGVDFAAIDRENQADYARRTEVNRRAKEARTLEEKIILPAGFIPSPVDELALIDKLQAAAKHNADIELRATNRAGVAQKIMSLKDQIDKLTKEVDDLQKKLDTAPPLPEPIDVNVLREKISLAKEINTNFALRAQKITHGEAAKKLEAEADAITEAMEKRTAEKQAAIAAAKLPVEGIGFGDGLILLNNVPFDQASDAEQLRVSIAIAMALNPKLKVIRVRDGSLLDDNSMKLLAEMATEKDYQIWVERVDSSGKVGFVLENGQVKK